MQSLPTEAGPLSHCSQCGNRVQAGTGSPTFVYGVGAVGHQHCPACGANWRYLWQEQASVAKRSRRPVAVIGGLLLIGAVGAVAVVAFRGSAKQYDATSTSTTTRPTQPPVSSTPVAGNAASAAEFVRIFGPANIEKTSFMQWLLTSAGAAPRFEVNQRVTDFVRTGRETLTALAGVAWPEPVSAAVTELEQAYGSFLDDADLVRFGKLYSPSYLNQLKVESQAVKDAASTVRHALGIPPAP